MTSAEDLSVSVREDIHHTRCLQGEENNKSRTLWCVESGGTGEQWSIPVVRATPVQYLLRGSVTQQEKTSQVAVAPSLTLVCIAI